MRETVRECLSVVHASGLGHLRPVFAEQSVDGSALRALASWFRPFTPPSSAAGSASSSSSSSAAARATDAAARERLQQTPQGSQLVGLLSAQFRITQFGDLLRLQSALLLLDTQARQHVQRAATPQKKPRVDGSAGAGATEEAWAAALHAAAEANAHASMAEQRAAASEDEARDLRTQVRQPTEAPCSLPGLPAGVCLSVGWWDQHPAPARP
eukprot:COSAG01_NODE_12972_length_1655_cov_2.893316_2_plen_211_part_01